MMTERLTQYAYLMRLNKPIPIFMLLWPTLWALWLASDGRPAWDILIVFLLGVLLMRSAGCILNDIADRRFDAHVSRTRERPLASGKVSLTESLLLLGLLLVAALLLVLQCNALTVILSFVAAGVTALYPFLKRITHLPQLGLGVAFSFGIPMAFAAVNGFLSASAWFVFFGATLWPVIYDTMYAMADRDDDVRIGVKSTAILFAGFDTLIIGLLQILFLVYLVCVGYLFGLGTIYYFSLVIVGLLFAYQQWLICDRDPDLCLKAFLNNHWVGLVIFAGIFLSNSY